MITMTCPNCGRPLITSNVCLFCGWGAGWSYKEYLKEG